MQNALVYWSRVFVRALTDTLRFFGGWKIILPPTIAGVTAYINYLNMDDATPTLSGSAWFGTLAFVVVFGFIFAVNFVLTPPRIEGEATKAANKNTEILNTQIGDLQRQISDRQARFEAINKLWSLRREGVEIRSTKIESGPEHDREYNDWLNKFNDWRSRVLDEAGKVTPNLQNWLETLERRPENPVYPHWRDDAHWGTLCNFSEILRRLSLFLEREITRE